MVRDVCLTPLTLASGVVVACTRCQVCRRNRVSDFVGRGLAEKQTSALTVSLTLTYREGCGSKSASLYYDDVQRMLKRLRKDGYAVRYICAGEFGTLKGRAHWHMVLFFKDKCPEVEYNSRVDWKYWPYGHTFWRLGDRNGIRYVLKYILKDEESVRRLAVSKKPPLGYELFMDMADTMVAQRLPMRSPEYSIAGESYFDRTKNQFVHVKFWLQGRMREMFFERYVSEWRKRYNEEVPETDYIYEHYLDPIARKEMYTDVVLFEQQMKAREALRATQVQLPKPSAFPQQIGYLLTDYPKGCVVLYDDGSVVYTDGVKKWHLSCSADEKGDRSKLSAQLSLLPLSRPLQHSIRGWLESRFQESLDTEQRRSELRLKLLRAGSRASSHDGNPSRSAYQPSQRGTRRSRRTTSRRERNK